MLSLPIESATITLFIILKSIVLSRWSSKGKWLMFQLEDHLERCYMIIMQLDADIPQLDSYVP